MGILFPGKLWSVAGRSTHIRIPGEGGPRATSGPHPSDVQPWSGDGAWISVTGTSSQGRDVRQLLPLFLLPLQSRTPLSAYI